MKTFLLSVLAVLVFAGMGFSAGKSPLRTNNNASFSADTIKTSSFRFHEATGTTAAENPHGVKNLLDAIKTFPASSYVLIRKISKYEWVVEKEPDLAVTLLNYKPQKVILIEGDVRIMNVNYDKKYAVIMQ